MKLYNNILLLILINVFRVFCNNQSNIVQYTIEDGLSHNKINCVYQDSYGFLWIGTYDGLNRFDGNYFTIYKNLSSNNNSISNNIITSISEDEFGNIWAGTLEGLNKYNRKQKSFTRYYCHFDNPNSLSSNYIQYVFCDKNGNVWIKTDGGLDKLNILTNSISNFSYYIDVFNPAKQENTASIIKDRENNLWIGTKDGLNFFDIKFELFERFSKNKNKNTISHNHILKIYLDKNGFLWIGTLKGLNLFNSENKTFSKYYPVENNLNHLSNTINDICEDTENNLWIATAAGLYIFNRENKTFSKKLLDEHLNNISINSIIENKSNIIWIGTSNYGLYKYDKKGKKFNLYQWTSENKPVFSNNNVTSIFLDNENYLWVGTFGEGLHILNRNSGEVQIIKSNTSKNKIINNNITYITLDSKNNFWIGTNNGINLITKKINNDLLIKPLIYAENESLFSNNPINSILESSDKKIWIGTKRGLHIYGDGEIESYYSNLNDSNTIISNVIYCLTEDVNRNIWIGTSSGITIFDKKLKLFQNKISDNEQDNNLIKGKTINTLFNSSDSNIWIGTNEGLFCYSNNLGKIIKSFSHDNGLSSNIIHSIEEDNAKVLWIGTYNGLIKLNTKTNKISSFDIGDGLQSYEFNQGCSFKSEKGELFFGGIAGVNYFFPDSIKYNTIPPKIVFTSFEIYDNKGPHEISIDEKDTVIIPHDKNHFSIEFSALDFTRPEKCKYAYKIEGIDEDWINLGNVRKATFSSIPPGTYTFRVKGSNNDNIWNETGNYIFITIEAPFYRSKFAWVFYITIFLIFVFLLFQYRTRNLRGSNKILREKEIASQKIAEQREELITKNKSITDSINYAKRIQEAILPSDKYFKSILPNSFILYMPKDIVSGDFYWITENNNKVFLAVVDCTGHGVPGAFMSIIGFELLRNITIVQGIADPSLVLNKLNKGVIEAFKKESDDFSLRDGMDISFCVIDKKSNTLEFAGAYIPIYIVRDNKIIEIKGDRNTVGLIDDEVQSFTKHIVSLNGVEMIYIFTDGYPDQFGGPEEKKFKFRRFRHLLLTIHKLAFPKQKLFLKESIEKWKGDLEQVDDILIIGFNPNQTN